MQSEGYKGAVNDGQHYGKSSLLLSHTHTHTHTHTCMHTESISESCLCKNRGGKGEALQLQGPLVKMSGFFLLASGNYLYQCVCVCLCVCVFART